MSLCTVRRVLRGHMDGIRRAAVLSTLALLVLLAITAPHAAVAQSNDSSSASAGSGSDSGTTRHDDSDNGSSRSENDGGGGESATPPGVVDLRDASTSERRLQESELASPVIVSSPPPRYVPGEFERFVNRLVHTAGDPNAAHSTAQGSTDKQGDAGRAESGEREIRRFGAELMVPLTRGTVQDYVSQVPPDYLITPGDELVISLWGSVNARLRVLVDRAGRITLPRVGSVMVAGVRYADVANVIHDQVSQVFKNFQVNVTLGHLRSIRVYITGFTQRPGSYTVSSLATIVDALMRAGGPSAAGSFRNIELHRGGRLVTTFDLYDLLLRGDTSGDRVLQAGDVVQIDAVGPQVAMIGSVNKPAIFELKSGETVEDVVRMAAGFTAVADQHRLSVERLVDRDNVRVTQIALPADASFRLSSGDVLRAFSMVQAVLPVERQNKRVKVEGEVALPGEYILPPASTIRDAIRAAGGLTPNAYLFGTEFDRESVRITQQDNYQRALRDMEVSFTRTTATQHATSGDEAAAQAARASNGERLIESLRALKPSGRIVLNLKPDDVALPNLPLEEGDRLYVPARPSTVGVFGSVFSAGTFLFNTGLSLDDYLRLAGGPTRGADTGSTFVVRANGSVVSNRQSSSWFGMSSGFGDLKAEPGDTVFVPEELDKTTFVQAAKEWTQILYQFGIGVAALETIRRN